MKSKDLNKEKLDGLTPKEAEEIFVEFMAEFLVQKVLKEEEKAESKINLI